jgi:ParB family transcriptional regulator, chromosome partitioning protein
MTVAAEKANTPAVPAVDKDGANKDGANRETGSTAGSPGGSTPGTASASTPGSAADKATPESRPVLAHDKRKALGRGLESLLGSMRAAVHPSSSAAAAGTANAAASPNAPASAPTNASAAGASSAGTAPTDGHVTAPVPGYVAEMQAVARRGPDDHEVIDLAMERIDVNPHQTRSFTDEEIKSLEELRDSVKTHGVIQPVTVRPGKDGRYFLITGERRMRASKMAGKTTIPAIVRIVSEQQAAEMTVIENLQRRDLNCIDLAQAYIMLSQDFGLTQEQIGVRVGVSRESVSNYMRLAKLPHLVQVYLQNGSLEFSHARLLLNLDDPNQMAKAADKAVDMEMSVDQLENYLFEQNWMPKPKKEGHHGARWMDPNVKAAERRLQEILGVRVKIRNRKGKGMITLEYASLEDFDRVLAVLTGQK